MEAYFRIPTQPNVTLFAIYFIGVRIVTNFKINYYGKKHFSLGMMRQRVRERERKLNSSLKFVEKEKKKKKKQKKTVFELENITVVNGSF